MSASTISHFETGTRKPSFDNLRRLADALDVTTDYLLGRVKELDGLAGADRLHRHYDRLSSEDRDVADSVLETLARKAADSARRVRNEADQSLPGGEPSGRTGRPAARDFEISR